MVVRTRAQRCQIAFRETIENPCVLWTITEYLEPEDLVCLKQVSKDFRFHDVIHHRLNEIHEDQTRKRKIIADLIERVRRIPEMDSGQARIPTLVDIFDIMCANKKWLLEYKVLRERIHDKLTEFSKDPLFIDHGKSYMKILFD